MAQPVSSTLPATTPSLSLQLSDQAISTVKHNIALCGQLVQEVLEKDIDWGRIPGVAEPFLWNSGAAKIMAAFNCYSKYTLLKKTDTPRKISFTFECQLISRNSGAVVATGIGAASTREVKHRYRWVDHPETEGLSPKGLKQRRDGRYRVPNPDIEDLFNTIAKMAAKRSDIDAVQSLPGVASTLRKLFLARLPQSSHPDQPPPAQNDQPQPPTAAQPPQPNWTHFFARLRPLGVDPARAHVILEVASIKQDWIEKKGKTLDEAYELIKNYLDMEKSGKELDAEWPKQQRTSDIETHTEPLFPE
ncbi:hypothetical protein ES708_10411 [subsurface metagenome]